MSYAIIAKLGLDSKDYDAGLKKAETKAKGFAGTFQGIGAKLGAILSIGAITRFTLDAVKYAAAMSDAAEATRTGFEQYQALAFAAREGGAEVAQLNNALTKATIAGEKAAAGNKVMSDAFARLGINVAAFNKLPTEKKLEEIGRAFAKSGESQLAFSDISALLGEQVAPKLLGVIKRLGSEGFDSISQKAQDAGNVMEKALADSIGRIEDKFVSFKNRALITFGEIIGGFEIIARTLAGQSKSEINSDMFGGGKRNAVRDQARTELEREAIRDAAARRVAAEKTNPVLAGMIKPAAITDAQVEQRISDILAKQADAEKAAGKDAATRAAEYAKQAKSLEMSAASAEVASIIQKGKQAALMAEMTTQEQIVALEKEKEAAMLRAQNIAGEATADDMVAAAKEVAAHEKEIVGLKRKQREEEEKQTREEKKQREEIQKQLDAIQEAERDRIDRTSTTVSELAQGGRNLGGDAVRGARRVTRLEDQAMRARTRGETEFADKLQAEAEGIRQKIPGLRSSEKDFSKDSFEKLKDIDDKMAQIAAKVGVAK